MRIGIDFDNTIICYDDVFCHLAKDWGLVNPEFSGTKRELRDEVRSKHDDVTWQRLQGKAYGEFIHHATLFDGVIEFLATCRRNPAIDLCIVSHKTEFGHFDDKRISLRDASRQWMHHQGILSFIKEENVHFETTREEKIERIKALQCTHFIDDLPEVLESPLFPDIKRYLFQGAPQHNSNIPTMNSWKEITYAILSN